MMCAETACSHAGHWHVARLNKDGTKPESGSIDDVHWISCGVHLSSIVNRATRSGTRPALAMQLDE